MKSTYWLEKVLKTISLYVNAFLCTLQHTVIHVMNSAPSLTSKYFAFAFV